MQRWASLAGAVFTALVLSVAGGQRSPFDPPEATPAEGVASGRIVFSSMRDSDVSQIWVVNVDGSSLTRLTTSAGDEWDPAWSPDGSQIAFSSRRDGTGEIYVMNADGSDQTRLTTDGGNYLPDWSPAGTQLVYNHTNEDNSIDLRIREEDGTTRTLVSDGDGTASNPSWSPDGARIAFTSSEGGPSEIHAINVDGSNRVELTDSMDTNYDSDPSWSPDGTKVAFTRQQPEIPVKIFIMDADGSHQTQVTTDFGMDPTHGSNPAWSPDGTRLVFDDGSRIGTMNLDGTGFALVLENNFEFYDLEPDWHAAA